jgi:2-keto-4-pentenoate hydratase/2-oxohepta-3-ene-1,7-dioic acid hydratase in catechol pathway
VLRYASATTGGPCLGLVIEETGGIPTTVLNLTACAPLIGTTFDAYLEADGFGQAKTLWSLSDPEDHQLTNPKLRRHTESVTPEQILPPVDITPDEIHDRRKFVVSIGLNYQAHRAETGRRLDLLMVKPVAPTGPYAPLTLTPEAQLVDHEAELACVLLQDVDLTDVPPLAELESRLAYFAVNDLTDRAPIILDENDGYTAAKADPGFLPIGPWMIHGAELPVFSEDLALTITCAVTKPGQSPAKRQEDKTTNILRDPEQFLRLLGEQLAADPEMAGVDRQGERHPFALRIGERWVLPFGSLLLTGTPGGTCIRAPSTLRRLGLLLRGGFSMPRARRHFLRAQIRDRGKIGYLLPGDSVETRVEGLGTQGWSIRQT